MYMYSVLTSVSSSSIICLLISSVLIKPFKNKAFKIFRQRRTPIIYQKAKNTLENSEDTATKPSVMTSKSLTCKQQKRVTKADGKSLKFKELKSIIKQRSRN